MDQLLLLAEGASNRDYAVGWATLALINAGLAQSKNRSGFLWFLGSLVVGPVATFFIVFLDPLGPQHAG